MSAQGDISEFELRREYLDVLKRIAVALEQLSEESLPVVPVLHSIDDNLDRINGAIQDRRRRGI